MSNTVKVDLGKDSYNIILSDNFVESIEGFARASSSKCILITQEVIYKAFEDKFAALESLPNLEFHFIGQGEEAKSIKTAMEICEKMAIMQYDRSSTIFAVGGGVVGDIAGFVASIFMRGISYVQYPTTLLAMIDSSIGGKTGVNLKSGKNLIGRIHQPKSVIIDISFLSTLPKREVNASLAEAIKYGFIYDRDLFNYIVENMSDILSNRDSAILKKIILRSCEIKSEVVSQDVNENDLRMILNFGHTVGHALEGHFQYKTLLHGESILYGMKSALYLSHTIGSLNDEDYRLGLKALSAFTLPSIDIKDKAEIIEFVKRDKKFKESKIRFVLIPEIGKANISTEITLNHIEESLEVL
ncbi:MAG TPA: 3-dehydroquinate synthase [Candidatus Marinimicrobia bacterium]|jgi:3-dehydroquinate synthase|nr:3-dehydroquinate synthase [Candidatus Neomarinimicrobiota bacterium]HIL86806.1 3-dehydroquinate synthase [Candidatus Neomarinimicrobiota bacterium]